nr:hypothetical protein [Tanacetum cinerariifolium]
VKATRLKTMQEAIEFATELMDKRIRDVVENKRKFKGTSGNNQNQPQQNKRQNTGRVYAAANSDMNIYTGSKPLCSKCDYHHEGPCPPRCNNSKRVCHLTRDCRNRHENANNNNTNDNNRNNNNNTNNNNRNNNNNNQKGNGCYECEAQGHFKRNCPKLKNNNRGNQGRNNNAQARVVYKTKFLTLGSSGLVCQEEGWIVPDVHRLPGIKQTNGKELLPTTKD